MAFSKTLLQSAVLGVVIIAVVVPVISIPVRFVLLLDCFPNVEAPASVSLLCSVFRAVKSQSVHLLSTLQKW